MFFSWFVHFARNELTAEDEDLDAWGGAEVHGALMKYGFLVVWNLRKRSS